MNEFFRAIGMYGLIKPIANTIRSIYNRISVYAANVYSFLELYYCFIFYIYIYIYIYIFIYIYINI